MEKSSKQTERLSIDLPREEHRQIKVQAASCGISIRVYVLECVRKRLSQETERKDLSAMTGSVSDCLKEVWDNEADAHYDQL
jgi:DNA-binding protein